MPSQEQNATRRHARQLLRLPGVNLVCPGRKKTADADTGRPCVRVGVDRKLPPDQLPAGALIPRQVDGVETDVVESTPPRALSQQRHRPLVGGISGCIDQEGWAGTLGGIVLDNTTQRLVALTNNHVAGTLYNPDYLVPTYGHTLTQGLPMLQPSPLDGGTAVDQFGVVLRAHPLRFGYDAPPNSVDAALASLDDYDLAWFSILNAHAGPFPFAGSYQEGLQVLKSGRATGATLGVIEQLYAAANITYSPGAGENDVAAFADQMMITGEGISETGDSGSLVLAVIDGQIQVVGLLFAGGTIEGVDYAMVNHIGTVAATLQISAWDGSVVIPRSLEGAITVNATEFHRQKDTTRPISHTDWEA